MNFIITREALFRPLQLISGIVEKKQAIAILGNVLLKIHNDKLILIGMDMEIEIEAEVLLESAVETGEITVAARKLFDVCRSLPDASVLNIRTQANTLTIQSEGSTFQLNTLPAHEYPQLKQEDYSNKVNIEQNILRDLLNKTHFAMGVADSRQYLNGLLLEITPGSVKCVASDGCRLALARHDGSNLYSGKPAQIIIPRRSVTELMRLLSGNNEVVELWFNSNRMQTSVSNFKFTTALIDMQYPDYNCFIIRGNQEAFGDKEAIRQSLMRIAILANEKTRGVSLQFEKNKLKISTKNTNEERANDVLSIIYAGVRAEILLNINYMLDILSALIPQEIRYTFNNSTDPVIIDVPGEDKSLYVVMPVRI